MPFQHLLMHLARRHEERKVASVEPRNMPTCTYAALLNLNLNDRD